MANRNSTIGSRYGCDRDQRAPLVMAIDDVAGHAIILNADAVGARPGNGSVSIVAMTP